MAFRTGLALALCAGLGLAGCMSSGTEVSDAQIDQFVKGKTTEAEVIAKLGPPETSQRTADGERMDMYSYANVAPRAESFIPFFGMFFAKTDMKSKLVIFTFSKNGVLKDWS